MLDVFFLLLGLAAVIVCAELLVDSSSKIARRYGVSSFIVGITVVAFGTSAPELSVGLMAGFAGENALSLGDVVGSSITNLALIAGLSALILPLTVHDKAVKRELPILMGIEILLSVMLLLDGELSRLEGFVLILAFIGFMVYVIIDMKASDKIEIDAEGDIDTDGDGNRITPEKRLKEDSVSQVRLWIILIVSLVGMFYGAKLTVENASEIAERFGLSQTLIGLTVVALATSLPELVTSITAAIKKEPNIVLGNCIGSNIFNILLVLGASSAIHPIIAPNAFWIDLAAMMVVNVYVMTVSVLRKRLRRVSGAVLVIGYITYMIFKVIQTI